MSRLLLGLRPSVPSEEVTVNRGNLPSRICCVGLPKPYYAGGAYVALVELRVCIKERVAACAEAVAPLMEGDPGDLLSPSFAGRICFYQGEWGGYIV